MGPDAFDENGETIHTECRSCGQNLTTDTEECPVCGSGVARYDVE